MSDTESPEGWVPAIGHGVTLEEVVERAFDYRGNVTVVKADGTRLEGYVFNRNRDVEVPFIQVFDRAGATVQTVGDKPGCLVLPFDVEIVQGVLQRRGHRVVVLRGHEDVSVE